MVIFDQRITLFIKLFIDDVISVLYNRYLSTNVALSVLLVVTHVSHVLFL